MNQIWRPNRPKSDKIVLIKDDCIYKGNPPREDLNKIHLDAENIDRLKNVYSIPFSYVKKIENQQNQHQLKIYFGLDSEEDIKLDSKSQKHEIFNFLRKEISGLEYRAELPNAFNYAKAQFFGIIVATGIFIWAMYFAVEMSKGYEFIIAKGRRPGIDGIVLQLAHFGIPKLIIGYLFIVGIALWALIKKLKTRSEIEILER